MYLLYEHLTVLIISDNNAILSESEIHIDILMQL